MEVGQKVKAKITLRDDLSDHGMGVQLCANVGDTLVVREVRKYPTGDFYSVSHEHVTDSTFTVRADEVGAV